MSSAPSGEDAGPIGQLERAVALEPGRAQLHFELGVALHRAGRLGEALAAYEKALALEPRMVGASYNAGLVNQSAGRLEQAEASYRRALEVSPRYADAANNLGNVLLDSGRLLEAEQSYRRALEIDPDHVDAHSNLICLIDLIDGRGIEEQQAERRRWAERHARPLEASGPAHGNARDPERRLRVGYVSADFRKHSASFLFGPVIQAHDSPGFEVVCYSGGAEEDEVTARLRGRADVWRPTLGIADAAFAELVRQDQVDILVDLSGHSAGSRLRAFARKPAPVQITAWGYATGTGLAAMDYFLADPILVAPEERRFFAEEVVDLPCWGCYEPPDYLPALAPAPAATGKPFTFGCLNRFERISDRAIAAWSRVLAAVPEATLLYKDPAMDNAQIHDRFSQRLDEAGIPPERVLLMGRTPHEANLAVYNEVDVALDPFPSSGGVTTAEALWMGVPVVTLLGNTPPGRLTASVLMQIGMADWIARNEEDYADLAAKAAADVERLAGLRQTMRARLAASWFGDPRRYTRAVESVYRTLWRRWCSKG